MSAFIQHEETPEEREARWERAAQKQMERNPAFRQQIEEQQAAINRALKLSPQDWQPGDWEYALVLAQKQDAPAAVREKATRDLATLIDFKFFVQDDRHKAARAALFDLASAEGTGSGVILERVKMEAVHLALGEADTPQYIRFGREWEKDEDGKRTTSAPGNIDPDYSDYFWQWLNSKVCKILVCILLEDDYLGSEDRDSPRASAMPLSPEMLERIPARALAAPSVDIHRALTGLSPRLQELAVLLADGKPTEDIAAEMGCAPSTVYVWRHNLKMQFEKFVQIE